MRPQIGFTFLEALVAGTIALVIPAVLILLLNVSNRQAGDGTVRMRMSQIATAVSEDFHRAGYAATYVYGRSQAGVSTTSCPTDEPLPRMGDPLGFAFCDETRTIFKAYRFADGTADPAVLQEYDPDHGWRPMIVGGVTVRINRNVEPYRAGQPSYREAGVFGVGNRGGWAWTNFRFDFEVAGESVTLPMQMQSVVCRNAPSWMEYW